MKSDKELFQDTFTKKLKELEEEILIEQYIREIETIGLKNINQSYIFYSDQVEIFTDILKICDLVSKYSTEANYTLQEKIKTLKAKREDLNNCLVELSMKKKSLEEKINE